MAYTNEANHYRLRVTTLGMSEVHVDRWEVCCDDRRRIHSVDRWFGQPIDRFYHRKGRVGDRPRSTDQYMEPNQPGNQNVQNVSTEVHVFHRTRQTDRAVYCTVPHTSGKELWLEPWPDDRSDNTGACLSRPTSHLKTYGRARIHFGRAGRGETYLAELDELSELSDTTLELDELSKLNDTSLELNELSNTEDGAGSAAGRNGPFQPKEKFIKSSLWDCFFPNSTSPFLSPFQAHSHQEYQEGVSKEVLVFLGEVISKFRSFFCWTGASHPATIECHHSIHQLSILSDLSSYQPYRKSDPYFCSIKWYQSHSFDIRKPAGRRENSAFEVVKAGSPLKLLSFSLVLLWFTRICSLGDLVCSLRTLRDNSCVTIKFENKMFGLHRKCTKEKSPRPSASQTSFKSALNYFDECVSVQEKPNRWSKKHVNTSKGESGPKRQSFQFDVQQFCDNFVKGVDKALKDVSKSQKKSTSTRAPVNVELTVLQPEHPSSLVLYQHVFEEEPLDIPHQCPCLNTWISLDEVPEPIFDVEDKPDLVFDEEATSIISTFMESHLCFDSGTTTAPSSPAPLLPDLQEHCEKSELVISLPDMFDKISSLDVIRFGLDKIKENCFSKSVFGNMINSFKIFEPDRFLDQQRFQNDLGISSEIILSFDQSLEQSKVFDHFEKYLELDLKQTNFCATKSFDSFVFKENSFDLNSSRHRLITDDLCWNRIHLKLKLNFLRSSCENFVDLSVDDILVYNTFFKKCLEFLIVVSQSELKLVCSDIDNDMHVLEMINVVAYLDKILVCNVYFDLHLDKLKSVLLVLGNDILIFDLKKYLSCTFDPGLLVFVLSIQERQVQPLNEIIGHAQQPQIWRSFVVQTGYLGASDRCSVQEGYLNSPKVCCLESNFSRKPTHQGFTEAWNRMKSFTDEEVMNFPNQRFFSPSIREYQISKGYSCPIKKRPEPKTIIGFHMDLPASQKDQNQKEWPWDLEVMIHPPKPARPKTALPSSFSQQTRKNTTKEAAECSPHEKQFELMILHDPNVFPQSTSCPKQKHCKDHELIASTLHENVLKPRISKRKHILTWLKNCRKEHELKLLRPKNSFDFVHDNNFSNLTLSLSFHNSFSPWPDFEIDKSIFGNQLTCLMIAHVLDDYPKCLDPVFGVLRIEKPFDYSFTRFDVVSLVALNKQDKLGS
ncbi:hypothetical protein IGI04_026076, partial [Brassica rapa subsp. trilocularis]